MSPPRRIYRWPIAIIILLIVTAFSATSQASESLCDGGDVVASFEASSVDAERQFASGCQRGYCAGIHSHFSENHNAQPRVVLARFKTSRNNPVSLDDPVRIFAFYVLPLSEPSCYQSWTAFLVAIG